MPEEAYATNGFRRNRAGDGLHGVPLACASPLAHVPRALCCADGVRWLLRYDYNRQEEIFGPVMAILSTKRKTLYSEQTRHLMNYRRGFHARPHARASGGGRVSMPAWSG